MDKRVCGVWTCEVCGREFALMHENRYTARNSEVSALYATFANVPESTLWDAFDCPYCGCQNRVAERKREVLTVRAETQEEVPTWPRFEDGRPVLFGDEALDLNGQGFVVHVIHFDDDGGVTLSSGHGYGVRTRGAVVRPTPDQMAG